MMSNSPGTDEGDENDHGDADIWCPFLSQSMIWAWLVAYRMIYCYVNQDQSESVVKCS